jgi:predicted permease
VAKRSDDDFKHEIESHLELETERLIENGIVPDAARASARRHFGNVAIARERFYEARRRVWLDHLAHDLRCALRNLRRHPVAAIVGITSLAFGIGATTATLTIRNAVFRKPPPAFHDPGQLSRVQVGRPDRPIRPIGNYVPAGLFAIWHESLGLPVEAAIPSGGAREVRTSDRTETLPVRAVTAGLFEALGVSAVLGRTLSTATTGRAAEQPAVLSHRVWQQLFDGRPDVVDQLIWIENQPYTVAGVLPPRFWFSSMSSAVWTRVEPQRLSPDAELEVIVRRPRGLSHPMLDARLRSGLARYVETLPAGRRQLFLKVSGVEGTPLGNEVALVLPYLLGVSVLLTLVIACANAAILMIVQWTAREHEFAIRASLGASRGRIVRGLLTESMLVAATGGTLGACATFALLGWIVHSGGTGVRFFDLSVDASVFVQTAVITLLTGIASGVAPALYETRRLHVNPLRAIASSDRVRQRWRHSLVVLEVAVTVALLVVTTAMIDGYRRIKSSQMGFATHPLLSVLVENPTGVPTTQVLEALTHLPGVAAAAASTSVPTTATGARTRVAATADSAGIVAERGAITSAFFSALGVRVTSGRSFSDQDTSTSGVAIVNEALARELALSREPVGSRIWVAAQPYDVVGVVENYASTPLRSPDMDFRVFLPVPPSSKTVTRQRFLVRVKGDPADLVKTIRMDVREAAAGTIVTDAVTVDQMIRLMSEEMLLGTAPLFPLIAIGLLLTAAGIYGVLAFAIARRSRELAVRVAVGASPQDLLALVSSHAFRLIAVGSTLGVALTFGLARLVRAGGGAGSIYDPSLGAFVVPVIIVLAVGGLATLLPSRRAMKIDPVVLLRST